RCHDETGLSTTAECSRHHRRRSKEECSLATCLSGPDFPLKRHDDPSSLDVWSTVDEQLILQSPLNSCDVVLDVLPVIIQIRIAVSLARCEEDFETSAMRREPKTRFDRPRGAPRLDQRLLELLDEPVAEAPHLAERGGAAMKVMFHAAPHEGDGGD